MTTVALLALWEALTRGGVVPPEIPPLSDILDSLAQQIGTSTFWTSLGLTVWHWAAGLVLGASAGIVVGVAIGAVPLLAALLQTTFEFLRPIPSVVYLPLLILVLGATSQTAIILAAIGAFWPMLFQTFYGVRAIDPMPLETGRVFGLTPRQRLVSITLPSILPFVATGLRISSSLALIVAVSIELIGGVRGIGADIAVHSINGIYPAMYALILVSGVLGLLLNAVLERSERRLLRWHVSHRETSA